MGKVVFGARRGTVLVLCALAVASLFPLLADARAERSGRADVVDRLCERQEWLGDRLKRFIIDPAICNPPPPPAEPTLTFSAVPAAIIAGQSSQLTWDSTDATSCTASSGWAGVKTADGSESVSPVVTTTYALECTGPGGSVSKSVTVTVTPAPAQPTLTLVKTVVNDDGGTATQSAFQAKIDGNDVAWSVAHTVSPGAHTVSETVAAGYGASVWGGDCAADGTITVALGENKTCTITNDDQPGTLRVVKVVVNDDAGTAGADDFSFQVNGGSAAAFESDGANDIVVDAGTYSVTEVAAAGYTTTYQNCTDVVVSNGETETCTITNDDALSEEGGDLLITEVLYDLGTGQGTEPGNEWVEIHNGTGNAVDLSGYALHDAAGSDVLPEGTLLPAGGYLIVTATSTTADFWTFPQGTMVVSLGSSIGSNGLGNAGDRVELRNASAELVDAVSWGTDVSAFDPSVAVVTAGHSITRSGGADTDTAADWADEDVPNPGA